MNYHRSTPTRKLFQQFRDMCLPEKLSAKIKSAETMENAWIRLEAWFGDKSLFIKDLMQDIKSVTPIKDGDDERRPRRAEEAAMAAEVPRAGTRGS